MGFLLGLLAGVGLAICFFRIIDGCWPWSRDRDLFAEEDARRQNEMAATPDNSMIRVRDDVYPVAYGGAGFSKSHIVVEGNGGEGGVAEYAGSGGGGGKVIGAKGEMAYDPPVVEVQPRTDGQGEDEQRFTTEEQSLDAGTWPPIGDKPDPIGR